MRTNSKRIKLILLALYTFVIYFSYASAFGDELIVRIGYTASLTGNGAVIGKQTQAGARLAAMELGERGINVILIVEDSQSDPKTAATSVKKLIERDKVDAVMCDLSGTCAAAAPIAVNASKLFVYQAAANSIAEKNKYAFKSFLDYSRGCREIARLWKERGKRKIGHIKSNTEYGEECLNGSNEVFPEQLVIPYNVGDDLRPLVPRLKDVEVALQTGFEGDFISRFKLTRGLGKKIPAGLVSVLLTPAVVSEAGADLESTLAFGFPLLDPRFVQKLKTRNLYSSESAIESAAIAYFDLLSLVESIRGCDRHDIDCQAEWFAKSTGGPLQMNGRPGRKASFVQVVKEWKGGKLEPVEAK